MPSSKRVPRRPQNVEKFLSTIYAKMNPQFMPGFETISPVDAALHLKSLGHIALKKGRWRTTPRAAIDYYSRRGVKQKWAELNFAMQKRLIQKFVVAVNPTGRSSVDQIISRLYVYHEKLVARVDKIEKEMSEVSASSTQYSDNMDRYYFYQNAKRALDATIRGLRSGEVDPKTGILTRL